MAFDCCLLRQRSIFYTRLQRPNNWLCTYVHNIRYSYGHWRVHWVFTFSQDNLCGIPRHSRHSKLVIAYYDNNLPDLILHARLSDLDVAKTSYTTYTECNCQVHKGFYAAEQKVLSGILSHVKLLISAHPGYSLKVTGHSLGKRMCFSTYSYVICNRWCI